MLMPKKTKYRKAQKGRRRKHAVATKGTSLSFGEYGLKSLETHWVTARQIEAARRVLTRYLRKGGKMWIRIFPDKPVTMKGSEVPMGGGKGAVDHYVTPVKAGTIIFEITGIDEETAKHALNSASYKLPVKTKFISKGQWYEN
ncbi:50S ribosomal protein L16 [Patescibacteria group bacterium AH-259-L05]|nr:50S ribosomal protein L16 [Patescibacteria group bacterium AH-259-L05]